MNNLFLILKNVGYLIEIQYYFAVQMSTVIQSKSNYKKWLKLLLKIVVSGLCIWYVSGKIDFAKAGAAFQKANVLFLILALIAFVISKIIASWRLKIYFKNIFIRLTEQTNLKLYWLGMFYNLFLPGSIGGDAYKVLLLKKKLNAPYKKTMAAVLLDRFSGLLALGLILSVYGIFVLDYIGYIISLCGLSLMAVALLFYIINRWLKDFLPSFFPTLVLGIAVQVARVICIYFIMASLHIEVHKTELIFLFLVSSIASVLPFTIGGLGIREIVFLQGSLYFGLSQETAVVISLLFYLITLVTSAIGAVYIFKDPLQEIILSDNTQHHS